jgi:hypothetical protein
MRWSAFLFLEDVQIKRKDRAMAKSQETTPTGKIVAMTNAQQILDGRAAGEPEIFYKKIAEN